MSIERIKRSMNFPLKLFEALEKIQNKDISGKSLNQLVVELLLENEQVKKEIEQDVKK